MQLRLAFIRASALPYSNSIDVGEHIFCYVYIK